MPALFHKSLSETRSGRSNAGELAQPAEVALKRREMRRVSWVFFLGLLACTDKLSGCGGEGEKNSADDAALPAPSVTVPIVGADAGPPTKLIDGGVSKSEGPFAYPLNMFVPIVSEMERISETRKDVKLLGYLRRGGRAPVIPIPHANPACVEGWFELVSGGFVCGRSITLDGNHPVIRLGPRSPSMTAALPYDYGYNLTNGTPIYRHVPKRSERVKFEPWLIGKPKRTTATEDELDAGAGVSEMAPEEDSGVPWYLRSYDGGKPQVTLDDLRGEDSNITRRMVRGFYLSLDKEEEHRKMKWWKTTNGSFVPFDRLVTVKNPPTEFHGVWLEGATPPDVPTVPGNPPNSNDAGVMMASALTNVLPPMYRMPTHLPIGFALWNAKRYDLDPTTKKLVKGEPIPRWTALQLTGKQMSQGGMIFQETEDGFWFRMVDGRVTRTGPPPVGLKAGEKWVDVNVKQQTLVAFEGDRPVYATAVSTGKKDEENEEKNHETKPGTFRVWQKHIAATMDGDVASDGPYSIEDVPWIMYFDHSVALHAAFWHTDFGHMRSHGCVNMAPLDARTMFAWTDPQLPEGWHGVDATNENPGTRIVVHE